MSSKPVRSHLQMTSILKFDFWTHFLWKAQMKIHLAAGCFEVGLDGKPKLQQVIRILPCHYKFKLKFFSIKQSCDPQILNIINERLPKKITRLEKKSRNTRCDAINKAFIGNII